MATTYHEIVVRGDKKVLRGFIAGFAAAKHTRGTMMCKGLPFDTHHVREVLRGHTDYEHLVCSDSHRRSLIAAIERVREEIGAEVVSDQRIRRASFSFHFETFNRKVATDVRRLLGRPPTGITFTDVEAREDVDPKSKGVEMYAPTHDYRFAGRGVAEGDVVKLLLLHEKFRRHEFIDVEDIRLEH